MSHANILGYAAAWQAEFSKRRIMDDLVRLWRGVPTRHQLKLLIAADKDREQRDAARLRIARELGLFEVAP